jgi:hypothetical protein
LAAGLRRNVFAGCGTTCGLPEAIERLSVGVGRSGWHDAGATLSLDRSFMAGSLGFDCVTANSIDATSDRDFALEFVNALSLLALHLSRWAEEMILFSSQFLRRNTALWFCRRLIPPAAVRCRKRKIRTCWS